LENCTGSNLLLPFKCSDTPTLAATEQMTRSTTMGVHQRGRQHVTKMAQVQPPTKICTYWNPIVLTKHQAQNRTQTQQGCTAAPQFSQELGHRPQQAKLRMGKKTLQTNSMFLIVVRPPKPRPNWDVPVFAASHGHPVRSHYHSNLVCWKLAKKL